MKIVVEMNSDEFQDFLAWQKDRNAYEREINERFKRFEPMARKILLSIGQDPKKANTVKIIDQEHAVELFEIASELFV